MKTNSLNRIVIIFFSVLLICIYSCTKRTQESGTKQTEDGRNEEVQENEELSSYDHLGTGDSSQVYGSGYYDYQDTILSYHMGYNVERDSVYKVIDIEKFERANFLIKKYPAMPQPYLDRGNHFNNIQMYEEAILDYDKYIDMVPDNHSGYMNRGNAHERLKHYDSALTDYSKVIELKPRDTIAFFNRGIVYDALDNPWQAIREYDSVLILDPKLAKVYYNRGKSYAKIRDYQKAIDNWERAIDLNPQYKEVLVRRINVLKGLQKEQ